MLLAWHYLPTGCVLTGRRRRLLLRDAARRTAYLGLCGRTRDQVGAQLTLPLLTRSRTLTLALTRDQVGAQQVVSSELSAVSVQSSFQYSVVVVSR